MVNLPVITWTQSCPPGLACGVSRTRLSAVTAGSVTSTPVSPIPHDARAGTTCQILAGADPNDTWAIFIVPLDACTILTGSKDGWAKGIIFTYLAHICFLPFSL